MLRRRVESDIGDAGESQINLEGLNRALQVLVIDGILIVPNIRRWIRHLVADEYDPIVSRVGFDLLHRRARPSHDGRLRSHGVANR